MQDRFIQGQALRQNNGNTVEEQGHISKVGCNPKDEIMISGETSRIALEVDHTRKQAPIAMGSSNGPRHVSLKLPTGKGE